MTRKQYFLSGLKDGMPICFGYFAVSFAFGIQAAGIGLSVFEASVLSALNVTSAGQFAALAIIASGASLIELAFTQLIINLRYFLMSCALSQKLSPGLPLGHRLGIAYGMTDEIFAVSVSQREPLSPFYSYGLIAVAIPGWVLGTALGAAAGNILPAVLTNALGIAIYGMFIAAFFPHNGGLVMLSLYLTGICVAVLSGFLLNSLVFRGKPVPFVMELPAYRLPTARNIIMHMWEKAKDFLHKAFTVIFLVSIIVWFLQNFDVRFYMVDASDSIIASFG